MKGRLKEENISKILKKINVNGYKSKELEKEKENNRGITLIALVITIIFSYDENVKSSNNKGFLLQSIWVKNHKFSNI